MSACKWQSSSSRIYKKNSHYFCLLFVEFSAFFNLEIHIWQLNDCNIRSNKTNHNAHIKLTSHEAAISYDRFVLFQRVFQMFYAYVYVFLAWSFVFIPKKCLFKKKILIQTGAQLWTFICFFIHWNFESNAVIWCTKKYAWVPVINILSSHKLIRHLQYTSG